MTDYELRVAVDPVTGVRTITWQEDTAAEDASYYC